MSQRKRRSLLERLPPAFREQYFSLFTGPEPETIHPNLYQQLIDKGTDIILKHLNQYNKERKRLLEKIRGKIKIRQLKCDEQLAKIRVVASDAGNNGVDLRSAFAPLYASTAIAAEGWEIIDEPICKAGDSQPWPDEFRAREREAVLAFKVQFEVTSTAVMRWEPKLVVVDGTLLLNPGLLPAQESSQGYLEDFHQTIGSAVWLLRFCYENDIPIVGFVKRTRSSRICRRFGGSHMRDTAILDCILRLGQYTLPESKPMGGIIVNYYKREARKMGSSVDTVKSITNIYSMYIRTGLTTPYRLEVPEYCLDRMDEIGTVLFTTSEENGIPFAINEADNLTRITTNVSNIRTLMLYSKALDLVKMGEMEVEDLNLLALQHGEIWTLRDDSYWSDVLAHGRGE
ncbi:MAG: DNA double-strand break repair nuclease NurA [Candidatus Freyarchaeota archaeon]